MKALLFDIGGTNMRLGVSNNGRLGKPSLVAVPRRYHDGIAMIARAARAASARVIIGGLPGPLDYGHTKLLQSTQLPTWAGRSFQRDLRRMINASMILENDSALVALGEAVYGAGRGAAIMAYIGIGTGIGGARIVNGHIDANDKGFEPGHHILDWQKRHHRHPSPHPGDWESFISGGAVHLQTGQHSEQVREQRFWRKLEKLVAVGLVNVAMFWSPEVIVLGGSLMKRLSLAGVRKSFRGRQRIFQHPPILRRAMLGDFGGLYGGLRLLRLRRKNPLR